MDASLHMAAVQNSILSALGTELRVNDDATHDDSLNGGQTQRLYFNAYNMDNFLLEGVEVDEEHPNDRLYSEVYSHYGGCSISTTSGSIPETVTPAVFGHVTTYSKDSDNDGIGGSSIPKYPYAEGDERLLITATDEQEGKGLIVVSGAAFMSNFEVQATIEDSNAEKNYANYKVCENLLKRVNPVTITPIAEVREVTEAGYIFTIEGIVTSNASGYDKDTAFFDCIYVQDETAGICCFPVAGEYKIGDVVRITGSTDFYQAEPELQVKNIEKIGEAECPDPEEITAAQENDRSKEGLLVKVSGTITQVDVVDGQLQTILYTDESGATGRIFIDGYITTVAAGYEDVANAAVGNKVTAIGLASYDDTFNAPEGPFPRIRIRNRADVVCEVVEQSVTVVPYNATAFIEGEDYTVSGRDVTVKGDRIVKIGYLDGDRYVLCELTITEDDEGTHYVYTVPEGVDEVALVLLGDFDLSGTITNADVTQAKAASLGRPITFGPLNLFAADVSGDGAFTNNDITQLKAMNLNKFTPNWPHN